VCVLAGAACRYSLEDDDLRQTRQNRSVDGLARFIAEHDRRSDAKQLFAKHYQWARRTLADKKLAPELPALFAYLERVYDPTVELVVEAPDASELVRAQDELRRVQAGAADITAELGDAGGDADGSDDSDGGGGVASDDGRWPDVAKLFGGSTFWYAAEKGTNRAVLDVLGRDLVVFCPPNDTSRPASTVEHPTLTIRWRVSASGTVFSRPGGVGLMPPSRDPLRPWAPSPPRMFLGIVIDADVTWHVPGQPDVHRKITARPAGNFSYETYTLNAVFADARSSAVDGDVYHGMVESAFQDLMAKLLGAP